MKLVSPVSTLLGGVTPEGMVCGVDGVCAPVEAAADEDSSTGDEN